MEVLKDWLGLAALVISVGTFLWNHLTSDGKRALAAVDTVKRDATKQFQEMDDRVDRHGERLQEIEGELRHLPDKETVVEIRLGMAKMEGQLAGMNASLGSLAKNVDRIDEFLRKST